MTTDDSNNSTPSCPSSSLDHDYPVIPTNITWIINSRLSNEGILVRGLDMFDQDARLPWNSVQRAGKILKGSSSLLEKRLLDTGASIPTDGTNSSNTTTNTNSSQRFRYLPASFLHNRLRSWNAIRFREESVRILGPKTQLAFVIATHYQHNNHNTNHDNHDYDDGIVRCSHYYPVDAYSDRRGTYEEPPTCRHQHIQPLCRHTKQHQQQRKHGDEKDLLCLMNLTDSSNTVPEPPGCDRCQIPGRALGGFVAEAVLEQSPTLDPAFLHNDHKLKGLGSHTCYYDDPHEAVDGSNSLWHWRAHWVASQQALKQSQTQPQSSIFVTKSDYYMGWTECRATKNIANLGNVDAIAIPLGNLADQNDEDIPQSLCQLDNNALRDTEHSLELASQLGYTNRLPVVLYSEQRGVWEGTSESRANSYCHRHWGGQNCDDGYQKTFLSQEFNFASGACLRRKVPCGDVYYFPLARGRRCRKPPLDTTQCMNYTTTMTTTLPRNEYEQQHEQQQQRQPLLSSPQRVTSMSSSLLPLEEQTMDPGIIVATTAREMSYGGYTLLLWSAMIPYVFLSMIRKSRRNSTNSSGNGRV